MNGYGLKDIEWFSCGVFVICIFMIGIVLVGVGDGIVVIIKKVKEK